MLLFLRDWIGILLFVFVFKFDVFKGDIGVFVLCCNVFDIVNDVG